MTRNEESDVVGAVVSALDAFSVGQISWDEMNLRLHDKRYHPHGYKEGDVCKYRDEDNPIPKESPKTKNYYAKIESGCSSENAESWVKKNIVANIVYATTGEELIAGGFLPLDAMNLIDWGSPVNKQIHAENVRLFYAVVSDILERYPKVPLMRPILTSWLMNNVEYYRAISTPDKRNENRTNYIALGDYYTGDRKNLDRYHIVRHEIGHSIATFGVLEAWIGLAKQFGTMGDFLAFAKETISNYAGVDIEETIAEAFACYTAPDYKKGSLPKPIEKIVEKMLSGEIPPNRERNLAMDEANVQHMREGIAPLDASYYPIIDTFIPEKKDSITWLDNKKGLMSFDTYEARFRHILDAFKVPPEWTDALCALHPDNKWTVMTAKYVVHIYRDTNTPIDKFLENAKTFLAKG